MGLLRYQWYYTRDGGAVEKAREDREDGGLKETRPSKDSRIKMHVHSL